MSSNSTKTAGRSSKATRRPDKKGAKSARAEMVLKLLPSEGDDYQYRIKSSGEAFERVAKESQLDRV